MITEQSLINEIFETYLKAELSPAMRQTIAHTYGEEIASKAYAMYAEAMNCPVDWRTATIDTALPILHEFLEDNYPWLSRDARKNINFAFIMTWK